MHARELHPPGAWPLLDGLKALVVDHAALAAPLGQRLRSSGVEVTVRGRGSDALVAFGHVQPDVVVVAPTLPDIPAAEVVEAFRRWGPQPVLVGVGPGDADHVGPLLLAGATVVCRPYDVGEVVHHLAGAGQLRLPQTRLTFGPLTLDPHTHTVHHDGTELERVPLKEFALLRLLMAHGDRVVPAARIRSALWADGPASPNALAVHVARLRRRLRDPVALRTVRGLGYRLTVRG